jgi:putative membrane protein
MMYRWYHDMGPGAWVFVTIFWVLVLGLVIWALASLLRIGEHRETRDRPEEILDRRLASGEIDTKTYDELRARLRDSALKSR